MIAENSALLPDSQLVTFSPTAVQAAKHAPPNRELRPMRSVGYLDPGIGRGTAFSSTVLSLISAQQEHLKHLLREKRFDDEYRFKKN